MESGLCKCGCGGKTTITPYTDPRRGFVKGEPKKYLPGHNSRGATWSPKRRLSGMKSLCGIPRPDWLKKQISEHHKRLGIKPSAEAGRRGRENRGIREAHPSWRGGISWVNGYRCIYIPEHPRAHPNGYVYEHILLAEKKIGRSLLPSEVVHHSDGNKANNDPQNLLVLSNQSEHLRLHHAQRRDKIC